MANVTETTNRLIEEARQGGIEYAEALRAVGEEIARLANSATPVRANEKQLDIIRGQVGTRHSRHIVDLIWAVAHELSRCPIIGVGGSGEANTLGLEAGASGDSIVGTKVGVVLNVKGLEENSSKIVITTDANDVLFDVDETAINHNNLLNYDSDRHIDHTAVSIIAGTALSGGGTIDADRTLNVVPGDIDHGQLDATSLTDDDHGHYALLAGRASGQTLKGGTGSGEHLTLESTSHGSKGRVKIESGSILDVQSNGIYNVLGLYGGNETLVAALADAVASCNYLVIENGITGFPVTLSAASTVDTNVDIMLEPKNSGSIIYNGAVEASGGDMTFSPGFRLKFTIDAVPTNDPIFNIPPRSAAPTSPSTDDIYLDDGTLHGSGNAGFRRWTGAAWADIGGGAGGGGGEANTASSAGSGTSIYYQKSGVDLQFNAIKSENALLTVSLDGVSHDVELTVNEASIDHDALTNYSADEHFTEASIDHTAITNIGTYSHSSIDSHIDSTANPHSVTAAQAGALANVVEDTTPQLGGNLDGQSTYGISGLVQLVVDNLTLDGSDISNASGDMTLTASSSNPIRLKLNGATTTYVHIQNDGAGYAALDMQDGGGVLCDSITSRGDFDVTTTSNGTITLHPNGTGKVIQSWSGYQIATVLGVQPPNDAAANVATGGNYSCGSTPSEVMRTIDFDDSTDEYMDFLVRFHDNYDSNNSFVVRLPWMPAAADNTKVVKWGVSFRRIQFDSTDLDSAKTYSTLEQTTEDASPTNTGEVTQATITFTNANADGVVAGELAIMRVHRHTSGLTGTDLTGDAKLYGSAIQLVRS